MCCRSDPHTRRISVDHALAPGGQMICLMLEHEIQEPLLGMLIAPPTLGHFLSSTFRLNPPGANNHLFVFVQFLLDSG